MPSWLTIVVLSILTSSATSILVEGRRPAFLGPKRLSAQAKRRIEREQVALEGVLDLLESTIGRPIRDEEEALALLAARA